LELLIGIAKNLLLIVVIATIMEILLPDSSMRPFVRFTIGLFVILAILNPVLKTIYSSRDLDSGAWDLPWKYQDTQDYEQAGLKINQEIQQAGSEVMKQKIERQITSLAVLVPGVGDLETEVSLDPERGQLSEVVMVVVPASATSSGDGSIETFSYREPGNPELETIREKLASMMRNLYGLEGKQVVIKFKGG